MACPLQKKYGDIICIDGTLWGLTYSDCAPPDQRQSLGPCDYCRDREYDAGRKAKTAAALDELAMIDRDML